MRTGRSRAAGSFSGDCSAGAADFRARLGVTTAAVVLEGAVV